MLGLWTAHASVGNIIGGLLAAAVLQYGYEVLFLLQRALCHIHVILLIFKYKRDELQMKSGGLQMNTVVHHFL